MHTVSPRMPPKESFKKLVYRIDFLPESGKMPPV